MRRADRLFQIIEFLRARRRAVTAHEIAETLEVSVRTIYRDMADLVMSGVPIEGEAGVGYVLRDGFHLPPIMLDRDEIEAVALGMALVSRWADPPLASAAERVRAKLASVLPRHMSGDFANAMLFAPAFPGNFGAPEVMTQLRLAVRERQRVALNYTDVNGNNTEREVRPLGLAFFAPHWTLASWCELREDFRTFRLDRMLKVLPTGTNFRDEPGKRMADYVKRSMSC